MHCIQIVVVDKENFDKIKARFDVAGTSLTVQNGIEFIAIVDNFNDVVDTNTNIGNAISNWDDDFDFGDEDMSDWNDKLNAVDALKDLNLEYVRLKTDYFGGAGEQFASFIKNDVVTECKSIDEALKMLGVVRNTECDEFDTIHLGRYRSNSDFK